MPEIQTILFITVLLYVICGSVLIFFRYKRLHAVSYYWGIGMFVFALGALMIALRGVISDYFSIVAGNILLMVGNCVFVLAMCKVAGRELPWKTLGAFIFNYIIFVHIFSEEEYFKLRNIAYSFTSIFIFSSSIYYLLKIENVKRMIVKYYLIFLFSVSIFVIFTRGMQFVFLEEIDPTHFNFLSQIYFMVGASFPIFLSIGYFLLVRKRSETKS